ncbi:MAG: dihydrolipoamide succinyltransferase, partial [Caldilineae bacterium]
MDLGGPEECVVVTWLKRVGDPVRREEPLVILQAEKVSFELPAPADGVLTEILANQGDVVTVGQIIARMAAESVSEGKAAPTVTATSPAETASPPERTRESPVRASPIAKRLAREHG